MPRHTLPDRSQNPTLGKFINYQEYYFHDIYYRVYKKEAFRNRQYCYSLNAFSIAGMLKDNFRSVRPR